eukprot:m.79198 g.79198  ORF g.79198 m.79198 type:complete len:94 (-) comp25188_c0_seq5:53-334(-)
MRRVGLHIEVHPTETDVAQSGPSNQYLQDGELTCSIETRASGAQSTNFVSVSSSLCSFHFKIKTTCSLLIIGTFGACVQVDNVTLWCDQNFFV